LPIIAVLVAKAVSQLAGCGACTAQPEEFKQALCCAALACTNLAVCPLTTQNIIEDEMLI
jgi:hypothetical protein